MLVLELQSEFHVRNREDTFGSEVEPLRSRRSRLRVGFQIGKEIQQIMLGAGQVIRMTWKSIIQIAKAMYMMVKTLVLSAKAKGSPEVHARTGEDEYAGLWEFCW
jgi:hypothetical protein